MQSQFSIPDLPVPQPVTLPVKRTAIAVLDMNAGCNDPNETCSQVVPVLGPFLDRARSYGLPIVFTVSLMLKGTPLGETARGLNRRPEEPIVHPDGFDKFTGGEMAEFLGRSGVENLVLVGWATNIAVMYTATTSARVRQYRTVLPVDGTVTYGDYERHYALHQLATLPGAVTVPVEFTTLSQLEFA